MRRRFCLFLVLLEIATFVGCSEEVLDNKDNVTTFDGTFTVDHDYTSSNFLLKGSENFSGTLSVNVTSPRWNVSSAEYADKCNEYPCKWDLSDERLKDKNIWVITENNGNNVYEVHYPSKSLFVIVLQIIFSFMYNMLIM